MPLWSPQAQFAGYYVALEKGFYVRKGLDLKILKAGPGISPADALEKGHADFAVLWLTTALNHHSHGIKLKKRISVCTKILTDADSEKVFRHSLD